MKPNDVFVYSHREGKSFFIVTKISDEGFYEGMQITVSDGSITFLTTEIRYLESTLAESWQKLEPAQTPEKSSMFSGEHWNHMRSGEMLRLGDLTIQKCFTDVTKKIEDLENINGKK
ncbi:MAG: hypothetical protein PHV11_08520 [Candidatus Bipolaricaulis sp.]|nr:hypothetical protein [Candidatus Bipolaricaulis sp.]